MQLCHTKKNSTESILIELIVSNMHCDWLSMNYFPRLNFSPNKGEKYFLEMDASRLKKICIVSIIQEDTKDLILDNASLNLLKHGGKSDHC